MWDGLFGIPLIFCDNLSEVKSRRYFAGKNNCVTFFDAVDESVDLPRKISVSVQIFP